jgi:hypothetical protein
MGMFNDALKEYGLESGEKLKFKDGNNQFRILSEAKMVRTMFKGTWNTKWVAWVVDRADGKVKLIYMPKTVVEALADYEEESAFKFDAPPMPYDIIVKARSAGTIDAKYTVIPVTTKKLITEAELAEFKAKKPIEKVVSKLLEMQAGSSDAEPAVQVS